MFCYRYLRKENMSPKGTLGNKLAWFLIFKKSCLILTYCHNLDVKCKNFVPIKKFSISFSLIHHFNIKAIQGTFSFKFIDNFLKN